MIEVTYGWSDNDEEYHDSCASREEAAQTALEDGFGWAEPGETVTVFTCENRPLEFDFENAASAALEHLEQEAYDECGDHAEGWSVCRNPELLKEVAAAIKAAIEKHAPCGLYAVDNIEEKEMEVPNAV